MNKKIYDSLYEWESMKPNREKVTRDNNNKKHFTRETVLTVASRSRGIKFRWFPKGPEEGPLQPVNIRGL